MMTVTAIFTGSSVSAATLGEVGDAKAACDPTPAPRSQCGQPDHAHGLDAETGVFMLLFLDLSYDAEVRAGRMRTAADLEEAIVQGAVKRIRRR